MNFTEKKGLDQKEEKDEKTKCCSTRIVVG
jgi:hypothetical protein